MDDARGRGLPCALLLLFILASFSPMVPAPTFEDVLEPSSASRGNGPELSLGQSQSVTMDIGPDASNDPVWIDLPNRDPLTSFEMTVEPGVEATRDGFSWSGSDDWNHPDAISDGVATFGGTLTASGGAQYWDFNSGAPGWTFSNTYSSVVTSPACGLNGSTGGSIRTYAGSTYATSPSIDLSGVPAMPLHVMIRQGSSSCGEEPDSNEDLRIQYKTATGGWTNLHTVSGSPASNNTWTFFDWNLPAAALHSNAQIRFHQTSGSSTCCDYWFIDDVRLAAPLLAEWTSPTIGWGGGVNNVEEGRWSDVRIEAEEPTGSQLLWTVLDGNAMPIATHQNRTGSLIDLSLLDADVHDELRIHLTFLPGTGGSMPTLHAMHLDGRWADHLWADPEENGWEVNASVGWTNYNIAEVPGSVASPTDFSEGMRIEGDSGGWVTTPWIHSDLALDGWRLDAGVENVTTQVRTSSPSPWSNVTLPHTFAADEYDAAVQLRFLGTDIVDLVYVNGTGNSTGNGTGNSTGNATNGTWVQVPRSWWVAWVHVDALAGERPTAPRLDLGLDGRDEWGPATTLQGIGAWGWQDRFIDGSTTTSVTVNPSGRAAAEFWVPTELLDLGLTVRSANGNVSAWTLLVNGLPVLNSSVTPSPAHRIELDPDQVDTLRQSLVGGSSLPEQGISYREVEFEVTASGNVTFGALSAPSSASVTLVASGSDPLLLAANTARSSTGDGTLDLDFLASTKGSIRLTLLDATTVSSIAVHDASMVAGDASPVVPSSAWRKFNATFLHEASAVALRLDVGTATQQDAWFLPLGGSQPVSLSMDAGLVELHPEAPVTVQTGLGMGGFSTATEVQVVFRLTSLWDDAAAVDLDLRMVDSDGVYSMPATYRWTDGFAGLDDDLVLEGIEFTDDSGTIPSAVTYLIAGTPVNVTVDFGWEEASLNDEPFLAGDAEIQVWLGEDLVAVEDAPESTSLVFPTVAPFTFGTVTWEVRLVSTSGLGIGSISVINRTFTIDPMAPRVLGTDIEAFDHRMPSGTQRFEIDVMDYVLLPSDLEAMVWFEWRDDANGDRWPDEGEHNPVALFPPNDLTASTGAYTLLLDDRSGLDGERVAVYITGEDEAGHVLEDGGTSDRYNHLFMYEIGADASPMIPEDAFRLDEGPRSVLHPGTLYSASIDFEEQNGLSDLAAVEFHLAFDRPASPMAVAYDVDTGNCTSLTDLVIVDACRIRGQVLDAHPFEKEMTLEIDFELAWYTPDLGDLTRVPGLVLTDRAGNQAQAGFDDAAWAFSAELEMPSEDVELLLSQGTMLDDGARLTPGSRFEVSGALQFAATEEAPVFDCEVEVSLAGRSTSVVAKNGIWTAELFAPGYGGTLPLTWGVACLPEGGRDVTDEASAVRWMVVDGLGPAVVEVISPLPGRALEPTTYDVTFLVEEEGGLDYTTLEMRWWVFDDATGDQLRDGRVPMQLLSAKNVGLRLEVQGTMDLSGLDAGMLEERLTVAVALEARDFAGNDAVHLLSARGQTGADGAWAMEWYRPEFDIAPTAVTYGSLGLTTGDQTVVEAAVENVGSLDGDVDVRFEIVQLDGTRTLLRSQPLTVAQGAVGTVAVDWKPESPGAQWIEVVLPNGDIASGPVVDVRVQQEAELTERIFGTVDPLLGGVVGLAGLLVVTLFLLLIARATSRQGSRDEYDWDDGFDDEFEDEHDDEFDDDEAVMTDDPHISTAASATVKQPEPTAEATGGSSDGWTQGADGVWWYHDPNDGSWWYRGSDGVDRKYG